MTLVGLVKQMCKERGDKQTEAEKQKQLQKRERNRNSHTEREKQTITKKIK